LHLYLQQLGAEVNLDQLNSLVEDKDMLAERIKKWPEQWEERGRKAGEQQGIEKGERLGIEKTARNLLKLGVLSDEQIAEATGLAVSDIAKLRIEDKH
jgi:predicted transposase/invertase (TIGR01784 family)